MTKIMTTIVAFDLIESNRLSLDDKFIISEKAWRLSQSGYSSMILMLNDEVSVENLLKVINFSKDSLVCKIRCSLQNIKSLNSTKLKVSIKRSLA